MHAEEIIAWKKKLDDEEFQVREIEKKGIKFYARDKIRVKKLKNLILEVVTNVKIFSLTTFDISLHPLFKDGLPFPPFKKSGPFFLKIG